MVNEAERITELQQAIKMYQLIISDESSPLFNDDFLQHRIIEMKYQLRELGVAYES